MRNKMAKDKFDSEVRQEQIVKAAMKSISEKGVKGLSMAKIAEEVGIVPSAIYRHFKNKEEILSSIVYSISQKFMSVKFPTDYSNPLESIKKILNLHVQLFFANKFFPVIIFSEEVFIENPEIRKKIYEAFSGLFKKIENLIQKGQEIGQIRDDIDPRVVSFFYVGLFQPQVIMWHLSDGAFDVINQTERNWEIFLDGIKSKNRKEKE